MAKGMRIHWQAPATVILALIAGTLFAVGHHIFYNSLDSQPAPNDNYDILGSHVSTQQVNIAGGTAFAFLVKACLAIAIGAAYAQIFWRVILHRTPEPTLDRLDTVFSALSDIHQLFKGRVWIRYPILFSLAVIAWLIPLAAIVTPATLSITSTAIIPPQSKLQHVPAVDFVNLNYVDYMGPSGYTPTIQQPNKPIQFFYNGPNRAVMNIAQAVAGEGIILPLKSPGLNSSYKLAFPAPTLKCSDVSSYHRSLIQDNIVQAMQPLNGSCNAYGFLAWTPATNVRTGALLPAVPFSQISNGSYALNSGTLNNAYGPTPATVYLAAMPNMMIVETIGGSHNFVPPCVSGSLDSPHIRNKFFANSTMLQCDLHNSTYITQFSFINGEQHVSVEISAFDNEVMTTAYWAFGPPSHPNPGAKASSPSCSPLNANDTSTCFFNSTLVSTLAYQAVLESFNELIVGEEYVPNFNSAREVTSNVETTVLVESPELEFLSRPLTIGPSAQLVTLQQSVLASNGTLFNGILSNQSVTTREPLKRAMENLFQNITISLMSSKKLQPDYASAFAPPRTNVTYSLYHNVYTYSAYKLWIAYGLAIFFASICGLTGLITIAANEASYSLRFSTVLRASRSAYMNIQLKAEDADIRDPLPPYLAKAKFWLGNPPERSDFGESLVGNSASEVNTVEPSSTLLAHDTTGLQGRTNPGPE